MEPNKIYVAFTREIKPDLVSRGIMWFLETNYSHVLFQLGGEVFHATEKGVHRVPMSEYLDGKKEIVHKFEVNLSISNESFLSYMDGASGKEYSESQYLGFIFKPLQGLVANGKEKSICSELVAEVLEKYAGFKLPKPADFMSPKDVYLLLKERES